MVTREEGTCLAECGVCCALIPSVFRRPRLPMEVLEILGKHTHTHTNLHKQRHTRNTHTIIENHKHNVGTGIELE